MFLKTIQNWRRLTRVFIVALVLGIPFVEIRGESAFRFDIPTLRLHFFGTVLWIEEFFILLVLLLLFVFLIILFTIIFGRFWCGWLCPQTIIVENTLFMDRAEKKSFLFKVYAYSAMFLISFLIGADFLWYFISPYEFIPRLFSGNLGNILWSVWLAFSLKVFIIFAFIRRKFCATVCPYAKLQDVLFDDRTLVIACDPERSDECLHDNRCIRACPLKIDIRKGLNALCINCAQCIDKCCETMRKKGKEPLISYRFGLSSQKKSLWKRPSVIAMMGFTLFLFSFFIYLVSFRMTFDYSIQPNYEFKPRINREMIINSYIVKLKNMRMYPLYVCMNISGIHGVRFLNKPDIQMKGGETKRLVVYIAVPAASFQQDDTLSSHLVTFSAELKDPAAVNPSEGNQKTIQKKIVFLLPMAG